MKKTFIAAMLAAVLSPAWAFASSSHYIHGTEGLLAATLPPPGFYYRMQNMLYSADTVKNNSGNSINADFRLRPFIQLHSFTMSTGKTFLGGRYAFSAVLPLVYNDVRLHKDFTGERFPDFWNFYNLGTVSVDVRRHSMGLSDIVVEPIILSWSGERWEARADFGIFMPTGRYSSKNPASPGKGFWTFKPGLGGTVYFDREKTWSASLLAHYEFHTRQKETRVIRGNHFHFEWGVGKRFMQIFTAGVTGYAAWQTTADRGGRSSDHKSRVFAAGPEIGAFIPGPNLAVTIRSQWEFGARNNSQGNMTMLALTKVF